MLPDMRPILALILAVLVMTPVVVISKVTMESEGDIVSEVCLARAKAISEAPARCDDESFDFRERVSCMYKVLSTSCGRAVIYDNYIATGCDKPGMVQKYVCSAANVPVELGRLEFATWKARVNGGCDKFCDIYSRLQSPLLDDILQGKHWCSCYMYSFDPDIRIGFMSMFKHQVAFQTFVAAADASVSVGAEKSHEQLTIDTDEQFRHLIGFSPEFAVIVAPSLLSIVLFGMMMLPDVNQYYRYAIAAVHILVSVFWADSWVHFITTVMSTIHVLTAKSFTSNERTLAAVAATSVVATAAVAVFASPIVTVLIIGCVLCSWVFGLVSFLRAPKSVDLSAIIFLFFSFGNTVLFVQRSDGYFEDDPVVIILKFVVFGFCPWEDVRLSSFHVVNSWSETINLLMSLRKFKVTMSLSLFFPLFFLRFVLPLAARTLIGAYSLRGVGGVKLHERVFHGFIAYVCDITFPIKFVEGITSLRFDRTVPPLVMAFMCLCEYLYALEFFMLHIAVGIFLSFIRPAAARKVQNLLQEYNRIQIDAFPSFGSLPWFDAAHLNKIMKCVVEVRASSDRGIRIGHAFVARSVSSGLTHIMSVGHVISGAKKLTIIGRDSKREEIDVKICDEAWYGNAKDAVTGVQTSTIFDEHIEVCDIDPITEGEIVDVAALLTMHSDNMLNICTNFALDAKGGNIRLSANFKKGDSGTPIFALMRDGIIKYAGATTAGALDSFSRNFGSLVCGKVVNSNAEFACVSESVAGLGYHEVPPVVDKPVDPSGFDKRDFDIGPSKSPEDGGHHHAVFPNPDRFNFRKRRGRGSSSPPVKEFWKPGAVEPSAVGVPKIEGSDCHMSEDGELISEVADVIPPTAVSKDSYCNQLIDCLGGQLETYNQCVKRFRPSETTSCVQQTASFKKLHGTVKKILDEDAAHGGLKAGFRERIIESMNQGRVVKFNAIRSGGGIYATMRTCGTLTDVA